MDPEQLREWLTPAGLADDLLAALNVSEIARRRFRDIARVAGLVFQGYPGSGKTARQLQASSGLIFDVLVKYDADNRLVSQARREVLARQLETARLARTLADIEGRQVNLMTTESMTPLAFPLWAERLQSQIISSEDWRTRVVRAAARLERAAGSAAA
jgi:ATP-dependent Lhr-like helicase